MSAIKQYQSPTGCYKLTITKGKGWQQHDHCRIQMSLRNDKYEGDKLFAILEWASHRFKTVSFILSDTLLRHNLMFEEGLSQDDAYNKSLKLGDEWLQRNTIISLFPNITIMRWDDILTTDAVNHHIVKLREEYNTNQKLKNAVNTVVHRFWTRRHSEKSNMYELFAKNGINYLIEELAVFGYLFQKPAVDLYAGQWISECIEAIQDDSIINTYNNINYLEIDLVRNKSYKQQPQVA